jgi:hypothetical protein
LKKKITNFSNIFNYFQEKTIEIEEQVTDMGSEIGGLKAEMTEIKSEVRTSMEKQKFSGNRNK